MVLSGWRGGDSSHKEGDVGPVFCSDCPAPLPHLFINRFRAPGYNDGISHPFEQQIGPRAGHKKPRSNVKTGSGREEPFSSFG